MHQGGFLPPHGQSPGEVSGALCCPAVGLVAADLAHPLISGVHVCGAGLGLVYGAAGEISFLVGLGGVELVLQLGAVGGSGDALVHLGVTGAVLAAAGGQ